MLVCASLPEDSTDLKRLVSCRHFWIFWAFIRDPDVFEGVSLQLSPFDFDAHETELAPPAVAQTAAELPQLIGLFRSFPDIKPLQDTACSDLRPCDCLSCGN